MIGTHGPAPALHRQTPARHRHCTCTDTAPARTALSCSWQAGWWPQRNTIPATTSRKRAEELKHTKYDAICAATGSVLSPFALETTGGHGALPVYFLLTRQMRDSGLPADVLVGKLKKDVRLRFAGARSPK
jgi:hypothetical protein